MPPIHPERWGGVCCEYEVGGVGRAGMVDGDVDGPAGAE